MEEEGQEEGETLGSSIDAESGPSTVHEHVIEALTTAHPSIGDCMYMPIKQWCSTLGQMKKYAMEYCHSITASPKEIQRMCVGSENFTLDLPVPQSQMYAMALCMHAGRHSKKKLSRDFHVKLGALSRNTKFVVTGCTIKQIYSTCPFNLGINIPGATPAMLYGNGFPILKVVYPYMNKPKDVNIPVTVTSPRVRSRKLRRAMRDRYMFEQLNENVLKRIFEPSKQYTNTTYMQHGRSADSTGNQLRKYVIREDLGGMANDLRRGMGNDSAEYRTRIADPDVVRLMKDIREHRERCTSASAMNSTDKFCVKVSCLNDDGPGRWCPKKGGGRTYSQKAQITIVMQYNFEMPSIE